jgi:amidohydrolase
MTTTTSTLEQAKQLQKEIVELRRHLHSEPELSFDEHKTADLAAEKLSGLGFQVKRKVGKTGLYGDLGKGTRIAIRADMDGLPIQETNETAFRSKNAGVMHACGHDAHVSCALAAAKILAGGERDLKGGIRMLMQPAEELGDDEGKSGAYRMIQDGVLEGICAIIGLHMDANIPAGKVGLMPGPVMAAADGFTITITGKGGHGAYPETTVDAVVIGAQVVQAIQQIVSRRLSALDPAIVTIGAFHSSSSRGNIISESVVLEGTFRSFSKEVRAKIMEELDRACSIARILGGDYKIHYEMGYPTTVNDPEITQVMHEVAVELIGDSNVITVPKKTWSEDFSMFSEIIPGAFMFLGAEVAGDRRSHHSATFDLDESGLYIGTAILAETARRLIPYMEQRK